MTEIGKIEPRFTLLAILTLPGIASESSRIISKPPSVVKVIIHALSNEIQTTLFRSQFFPVPCTNNY